MRSNKIAFTIAIFMISAIIIPFIIEQNAFAVGPTFQKGDVIVATGSGQAKWYQQDGTFIQMIDCTASGTSYTTGMAFDKDGNLYITMFGNSQVCKVDTSGQRIGNFGSGYSTPEKILFDSSGNAYVGNKGGFILKFDPAGNFLQKFNTGTVDFMDLSADQCTMLFGQEGTRILRYDVCNDKPLSDFSNQLSNAFAMRILSDGGLLVADRTNVKRLDSSGNVIKTYDSGSESSWFALNLDPDGTSFWSANFGTGGVYKFDIESGQQLLQFNSGSSNTYGIAIFGESTAAVPTENPKRVCMNYNFDGEVLSEEFSGVTTTESVSGFTAEGFSGNYLRNTSGGNPAAKTTLTLTNLPSHNFVDIGFLLAIIDSWDGETVGQYSPDIMNVEVDGNSIFSTGFVGAGGVQTYVPSEGVLLLNIKDGINRAGNSGWNDSAYNMTNESIFRGISHTSDTLTIDWYASGSGWQGGNDESWAIDDLEVCTDTFVAPTIIKKNSGDNQWDTRPSFGISHEDRETQIVENGFRFNNEQFTLTDNHWTPFEEQSVEIGTVNTFAATVYADKGLKVQEFLFGIPEVGEAQFAELGIEVWYDINGNIDDVKVVQKSDVIDADTISVSHEKVKCLSTESEEKCDNTTVSMKFLEPLKDKVMAIKAIDWKNRDQRTFLNEGFDISGKSLNPMLTKMIPSNARNQGLIQVTQVEKYSPYWVADDGRMFEMNSFGSFKEINQKFERFQDTGNALTRMHSGFGGIIDYEKNRATQVFDATKLISELPDSFGYHFEFKERMSDEMKQQMQDQEQIAKGILDEMDKQNRYY